MSNKTEATLFVTEAENACYALYNKTDISDMISITRTCDTETFDAWTDINNFIMEWKNRTKFNSESLPKEGYRKEGERDDNHKFFNKEERTEKGTVWCRRKKVDDLNRLGKKAAFINFFDDKVLSISCKKIKNLYDQGLVRIQWDWVYNPVIDCYEWEENYHVPVKDGDTNFFNENKYIR